MLSLALFVGVTSCGEDDPVTPPVITPKGVMTTPNGVVNAKGAAIIYYGDFEGTHYSSLIIYGEGVTLNLDSMRFEGMGDVVNYDLFDTIGAGLATGTYAFDYNLDIDAGFDEALYFINADLSQEELQASYFGDENSTGTAVVVKNSNTSYNVTFNNQNVLNATGTGDARISFSTTYNSTLDYVEDLGVQAPQSLEELLARNPFRKYSAKNAK